MAILSGKSGDRPAYAMTLSLYGARLTGCPLNEYFSDSSRYIKGQIAVRDTFCPDVLFGPFAFAHIGAAFGGTMKEFPDQAPIVRKPAFHDIADLEKMVLPDPDSDPYISYYRTAIAGISAECGRETPIAAILPLPIDLPALIFGMDIWMEMVLFNPEGTRRVLDLIIPFFVDIANRIFQDGADFIVSPCAFSSPSVVTREIAVLFAVPVLRETLCQLNGPVVIHHGGAPVNPHLDLLSDLPGVIGYAIDAQDDVTNAREMIGPKAVLFNGPDNFSLATLTPDEILTWCTGLLKKQAGDPKFILCNSGPDIPLSTPPENIHAFKSAVCL